MAALGPFGHRSYSGDHGQRRPEAELDEIDGRRREGEGRGHGEDPLLTRNPTEGSVRAEEAERRQARARTRRREADVGDAIRPTGGVLASAAGEEGVRARGGPHGGLRVAGVGRERRRSAPVGRLGFGRVARNRERERKETGE